MILESDSQQFFLNFGYKKLIAASDYKTYGHELETVYQKISRKKQGSKAFKRALTERNNKTNQFVAGYYKRLSFESFKEVQIPLPYGRISTLRYT